MPVPLGLAPYGWPVLDEPIPVGLLFMLPLETGALLPIPEPVSRSSMLLQPTSRTAEARANNHVFMMTPCLVGGAASKMPASLRAGLFPAPLGSIIRLPGCSRNR